MLKENRTTQKIIHIDMDCFYAAIEMREQPALAEVPLAVGGKDGRRGVVTTCNYLAREFGVHSAMSVVEAKSLCPQLVLVPTRIAFYREISAQIQLIFQRYTPLVEPVSLDEAYLDVSDVKLCKGSATWIAQSIRQDIQTELGLTASAGIAPVKFLAKIASDMKKPNGQFVIKPNDVADFVRDLPLEKIPGVGRVTLQKLHDMGLFIGKDVQDYDRFILAKQLGKFGQSLWLRAQGIDERSVIVARQRKSVGIERTLRDPLQSKDDCLILMSALYEELEGRLFSVVPSGKIARQGIKLKFSDFQQTTVERHHSQYERLFFESLLDEALERQSERGIRLLGLTVGLDDPQAQKQLTLNL
jgi:DNA polymerase-4